MEEEWSIREKTAAQVPTFRPDFFIDFLVEQTQGET